MSLSLVLGASAGRKRLLAHLHARVSAFHTRREPGDAKAFLAEFTCFDAAPA